MIICIIAVCLSPGLFGQDSSFKPVTRQDYLERSKKQKIAAWILLGSGVAMIAIAAPGDVSLDALPVLAIASAASIVSSIILFSASGRNKRKGMSITSNFDMRRSIYLIKGEPISYLTPTLSFKLRL